MRQFTQTWRWTAIAALALGLAACGWMGSTPQVDLSELRDLERRTQSLRSEVPRHARQALPFQAAEAALDRAERLATSNPSAYRPALADAQNAVRELAQSVDVWERDQEILTARERQRAAERASAQANDTADASVDEMDSMPETSAATGSTESSQRPREGESRPISSGTVSPGRSDKPVPGKEAGAVTMDPEDMPEQDAVEQEVADSASEPEPAQEAEPEPEPEALAAEAQSESDEQQVVSEPSAPEPDAPVEAPKNNDASASESSEQALAVAEPEPEPQAVPQPEPQASPTPAEASAPVAAAEPEFADSGEAVGLDKLSGPSDSQIARLGDDLTPMGAPVAGNTEGTIPAWTGGITSPPAGYSPGDHHPDPFASDSVRFTITADNYQEYADKLSVGQRAMFERYPDYQMNIYPTRRSASFPDRIYEMTERNARNGGLTGNGEGVTGVSEGFPFAFPKNAYHLMWNHKLKYKGKSVIRYNNQIAPTPSGAYSVTRIREELLAPYFEQGATLESIDNILAYFFQIVEGPARLAGNILLVHETLNQVEQTRQAWVYNPGQRRVRRAPNVAYDNPGTASDGLTTNDMTDMFNGALDRYTWRLKGKREMYIPYNAYKAHSDSLEYEDFAGEGHVNPDLLRYELHRVWVVDATLKDGVRHINPRRTFYLDEDSYQIVLIDHYDSRGELWRHSEGHPINYYEMPLVWTTMEVHHDLASGRFIATGIDNQDEVYQFDVDLDPNDYTPSALRIRGRR